LDVHRERTAHNKRTVRSRIKQAAIAKVSPVPGLPVSFLDIF